MSTILIPQRRGALRVLLLVSLLFPVAMLVALGPVELHFGSPLAGLTTLLQLLSRAIPVAGGLYAAAIVQRLLRDPRPRLAIDDIGVRSVWIRDGVLAWRDIAEASVRYEEDDVTRMELLCVRLRRPSDAATRFEPLPGLLGAHARRRVSRTGVIEINVVGSGHTPEELAALINDRVRPRTHAPAPNGAHAGASR
jgi:hypothetical protein